MIGTRAPAIDRPRPAASLLFWLCLLVAVVLRIVGLTKGYRSDEIGMLLYSANPIARIPAVIIENDAHPPLWYFVCHLFERVGLAEAWMRLPSVVLSVVICALVYVVGRGRVPERTRLAATWLVAIAPGSIFVAQLVRSYVPATVFVLVAVLVAMRMFERQRITIGAGAALAASEAAALYTFYFSALLLFALGVFGLWTWRRRPALAGRWVLGHVIVALVYLPWVPLAVHQLFRVSGKVEKLPGLFVGRVYFGGLARAALGAAGFDDALFFDAPLTAVVPRLVLIAGVVVIGVLAAIVAARGYRGLRRASAVAPWFAPLVATLAGGTLLVAIAAHLASGIVLSSRYVYMAFVFAAYLGAGVLETIESKAWRLAGIMVVSALLLVRVAQLHAWREVDWKTAAAYVGPQREMGDVLVYVADPRAPFYFPDAMRMVDVRDLLQRDAGDAVAIDSLAAMPLADADRLWVGLVNGYLQAPQNRATRQWLAANGYTPQSERRFGLLDITLYTSLHSGKSHRP